MDYYYAPAATAAVVPPPFFPLLAVDDNELPFSSYVNNGSAVDDGLWFFNEKETNI